MPKQEIAAAAGQQQLMVWVLKNKGSFDAAV